jgi:nicotinamide-nucleotide amidase
MLSDKIVKAELISIGDELLIGQVVNTNQAFIAEKLNSIGIVVTRMTTVGDEESEILDSFIKAFSNADIITVTGGLGPTHDDVTRSVVCKFLDRKLVLNEKIYAHIKSLLRRRGIFQSKINEDQALVPEGIEIIFNNYGTAPGYWIEHNSKTMIVMPGVPHEMKAMIDDVVIPRLRITLSGKVIKHKTIKTSGIPESLLAEKLKNLTERIAEYEGLTLAFLPSPFGVRLRISVNSDTQEKVELQIRTFTSEILKRASEYIYGYDDDTIEQVIGRILTEKKLTLAVAESCTGGLVTDRITNVPGSSNYFERGVVAYSNESKMNILGVSKDLIEKFGAVSKEVAEAMAEGVRKISGTDIGISTTGIAGPSGGSPNKPVGLVWIGYSDANITIAVNVNFPAPRRIVKERGSQAALNLLWNKIK